MAQVKFFVGNKQYAVDDCDNVTPSTSLNEYLRDHLHLTGTKKMCFEGGCGACVVAVEKVVDGVTRFISVNSCLVPVLSCNGWKIHTVDTIGNPLDGYHSIQKLLAEKDGTQCGYCSPGMVMNMYALNRDGKRSMLEIEDSFGGNLCRCTGYRPIMTAFKTLAKDSPDMRADIEDLDQRSCSKPDCCKGCKKISTKEAVDFSLDLEASKWVSVSSLRALHSALMGLPSNSYRFVAGDTAKGVYKNQPAVTTYIDINNVSELHAWSSSDRTLTIGASISLNRTMEILKQVSSKSASWSYLNTIAEHIDKIAGFSIRNTATIAGNLMIKHEHKEFPSDVFLILETFNATVVLDKFGLEKRVSPKDFLTTDMAERVIKAVELHRMDKPENQKYATYKIMPRAQNAHAIVNAGFLVKVDDKNVVQSANIIYGAINESFIHATNTEKYLVGKNIFTNEVVQGALKSLGSEIQPTESSPDATPEYRKGLALALFYKFILKVAPKGAVSDRFLSGGNILERPVSSALQEFGTNTTYEPVGKAIHKVEGLWQTSGQAQYIDDMPDQPHQLHAAFVLTEAVANSTIESIDTSEALKLEGVVAVYTAEDIPGDNNFIPLETGMVLEEKLFCDGTVEYYNQPLGVAVADSFIKAQQAASLVKVTYNAPTSKPYLTVDSVIKGGDATKDRIEEAATLDPEEKGTDVAEVIKGTYFMGRQYAFHMELQCCNVVPTENGLDMYPSTQWADLAQISASKALKIPSSQINVFVRRLGGGFGSKISRNSSVSTAAALAAFKTRRPVKMRLPLETNMRVYGHRLPLRMNYEVGVNKKGVIQYADAKYYSDFGIGIGNDYVWPYLTGLVAHCYDKKRWGYKVYNVKTDTSTNCYVRAPGSTEGMGSTEALYEHISYALGLDPWEVRMANYDEEKFPLIKTFAETMKTFGDIEKRKAEVEAFNKANRWRKRGLSVVPMAWQLMLEYRYSVLVSIFHADGSVAISHGGVEMGQGMNTKVVQAAAYKLGVDTSQITIQPTYTVISSNAYNTGGSVTSEVIVFNTLKACEKLLSRMEPVKQKMDNPTWKELTQECYNQGVNLTYSALEKPEYDEYYIYGMSATEVEIDILTGEKQVLRVDILEDLGESLSPLIDMGQVEGAFVMGIGYYTQEEIIFNENGELLSDRTWNYKPPGAKDIPLNFRIKFPEGNPNPVGVLKSKAVAEPPLCLSVSVPLAMRRAVADAIKEVDPTKNAWIPFDGPLTTEKTFLNSLNSTEQYLLK